jgi:hypothetical protein
MATLHLLDLYRVVGYRPPHLQDPHWPRDMAFARVVMNLDTQLLVHRCKASEAVLRSRLRRLASVHSLGYRKSFGVHVLKNHVHTLF